ncbi:MAG: hypothetical protein GXO83_03030 [Chlorobi bacterium]|nr:hypothetical protein [Chlorobiota bacterium]
MKTGAIKTLMLVIILSVFPVSCKRNPLNVKISGIEVNLKIQRFEQDLFKPEPGVVARKIPDLQDKYGLFLQRFGEIIHIGHPGDPLFAGYLEKFISDTLIRDVYLKSQEVFPDVNGLEKKLNKAFRYYKYYFPDKPLPEIITYISGFNASLMIDKGFLGIGLDRYLGKTVDYYDRLGIPRYLQQKMIPEKIPSDCMSALAQTEFPFYPSHTDSVSVRENVISHMIYKGKLLYFVKAMMPHEKDELILGFTSEQLKWCLMNEGQMWATLIEQKLLFSTHYLVINKLTRDAPFTSYFPRESPGRAANWIGWQIVQAYMSSHKEVSLAEMMNNYDYQKILDESGYNPE